MNSEQDFSTLQDVEDAMNQSLRDAQIAKAQGNDIKELQHMATAERMGELRNAVDAYGDEILLPDEAFENR